MHSSRRSSGIVLFWLAMAMPGATTTEDCGVGSGSVAAAFSSAALPKSRARLPDGDKNLVAMRSYSNGNNNNNNNNNGRGGRNTNNNNRQRSQQWDDRRDDRYDGNFNDNPNSDYYNDDPRGPPPPMGMPSMGGQSMGMRSMGGPSMGGPSMGGPSMGGPSMGGRSMGGPSMGGQSMGGPSMGGPSMGGPSMGGRSMGGQSMGGRSMGGPPIFGNGEYYQDSSEDFRTNSRGDRYRRRDGLRGGGYDATGDRGGREVAFGARRNYKGYGEGNGNGGAGNLAYPDRSYGGDFGNDEFRGRGSGMARPRNSGYGGGYYAGSLGSQRSRGGDGNGIRSMQGSSMMRDDYGPSPQEMRQPDNQLARYGQSNVRSQNSSGNNNGNGNNNFRPNNQQQRRGMPARMQDYFTPDAGRGNVRQGSSNNFRRGSSGYDRIQDFQTPRERELGQQRDNQGARYGWQQQYDTGRGNVRRGSSNDFRRGSSYDRKQDFSTPREREMQQMRDNRELIRGGFNGYDDGMGSSMGGEGVYAEGYGPNQYYEPEIMDGGNYPSYGPEGGQRRRNQFPSTWETVRGLFR